MNAQYRYQFTQSPSRLLLDLPKLKSGLYDIKGDIHRAAWHEICERLKLTPSGECSVRMTLEKASSMVTLQGRIWFNVERECVRTMEKFTDQQELDVFDQFGLNDLPYVDSLLPDATPQLDVRAYVEEQICLGLNAYPIHPSTLATPRGNYGVEDELAQRRQQQKADSRHRPFANLDKIARKA